MAKTTIVDDEVNKWRGFTEVMAPDRVRASVGVTHNLGDFNSVRIDISWESNVEDGETVEAALERTYRKAESTVEDKLSEYET
jgi:hypothetical protein